MGAISDNDRIVGQYLLELFLRGPGGCDGIMVTYDQALSMLNFMHQPALPRIPIMAMTVVLSQIDQIIAPKLDGSRGYILFLGWSNDKLLWLEAGNYQLTPEERQKLEAIGKLAHAHVVFPYEGEAIRYTWR